MLAALRPWTAAPRGARTVLEIAPPGEAGVPSKVLPDALGGKEGRSPGRSGLRAEGAGLQTAESNRCRVKKWDREKTESRNPPGAAR